MRGGGERSKPDTYVGEGDERHSLLEEIASIETRLSDLGIEKKIAATTRDFEVTGKAAREIKIKQES